jgi:hypothetical protein
VGTEALVLDGVGELAEALVLDGVGELAEALVLDGVGELGVGTRYIPESTSCICKLGVSE